VVYETLGEGKPVLLLPAFSTVSTRGEMRGIAERLSSQFQVLTLDDAKLTPNFIAHKREITQQPGARFAPVAFVTGKIDPVQERTDFLAYFQALPVPVMVIIGENVPSKSREEMDALTELQGVQTSVLPGSLGMHEEFADTVYWWNRVREQRN